MLCSSMDGLLFNPQMMADVNGNSKIMNAELEVKKLQELVRKLERQNEQLRTRANAANNCTSSARLLAAPAGPDTGNYCVSPSYSPSFGLSDEHYPYFHPQSVTGADEDDATVLDEVEILDLHVVLPIDGESDYSWLYVSPKAKLFPHLLLSPLQWCRHVLDNPRPEVELAKRSLCYKLDQAKRWRGVLSSSVLYSPVDGLSSISSCSKPFTKPALTEQTDPPSPNHQKSLTGRNCSSLTERSPTFLYHMATHSNSHRLRPLSPQSSIDCELSVSELEDDTIPMSYKLQDMTDVEVMARLQEESLRQEYASTAATATRRSASFSVHTGACRSMRSEAELEEEEEYDQLSAPQPQLFRTSSMQRSMSHSQSLSSMKECRRSPSTPQYLNSLSYQQLHMPNLSSSTAPETQSFRANTDKLRRSMPNLIRAPSIPSVISVPNVPAPTAHIATSSSSLSLLRNSQSFDSHSGLTKIQSAISGPSLGQLQQRVQSVGNFSTRPPLKATAYVSPTIQSATTMPSSVSLSSIPSSSSIPLPSKPGTPFSSRSALPRPASFVGTSGASRSKIAQPIRSLLTPPKSVSALSALRDGSWRDGCY
ncbi:SLAIN motif-containing protein 1-like isoform X1 [Sinocyclocheilus rhinocerous]|uniref:SLAIN motif-containing protein 1-like isoform X1 n=1 Tax=Sinocyclocheilus rhinocerous TaxID=307959 RepID=UPI0007BA21CE|nr:PREDICTED: SLAIN motif-containing protein 1-like isoform X1 [Sinocyclocheilus rhinocerous]